MAEAAEQRARARIGTVVRGKYRIESLLARGSMACVYAATHRNASRVALKVLHPHLARDPSMRERFRREGYFANSIAHEGVPRAIDDDETEDGCAFIVMELLEGETLEQRRLRMGGKLPLTFVLTVADTVLDILATAHQHKILHRDLKPDNVFITFGGQVKLLDFGVARWDDQQSSSDMTAAGMVVGTPAFMPPEQALGKRESVDARSDLWAFGATLFVVIAGETVHAGGDAKARLIATARTPARKLQEVAPFVPRGVAAVVDRALAFDKKDRWPDALAMREALRWARRSLDAFALDSSNEGELHRRPSLYPAPSTIRGGYHEEPTRRGISVSEEAPEEDEPTLARAYRDEERDVITSAPSITREVTREVPVPSEAVASSATSGPVFSLRREKPDDETDPELGPTTEPQLRAAQASEPELARSTLPGEMSAMDTLPGEVTPVNLTPPFRARSEATRTMPFGTPIAAPRPAAGTPASASTPPTMGPAGATTTAILGTPAAPTEAPRQATMKSASVPPELAQQLVAGATATSSPPAQAAFGSLPPLASSAPPAPSATTEPTARSSVTPGPVLTTLVKPSRGSVARAAVSVAIGIGVLAGATALIVKQQHAKPAAASDAPPPPAATEVPAAAPSVAATPTASVAAAASAQPSAAPSGSAAPEETKPPELAMAAATHATPPVAPRPRPSRPRPRPSASAAAAVPPAPSGEPAAEAPSAPTSAPTSTGAGAASAATSAPATEAPKPTPTAETPAPAPKPVPTEDPSLPRVD